MENFFNYINSIKQNKINDSKYINSLSDEVLNIFQELNENKIVNVYSFKVIPFFQQFISFDKFDLSEKTNTNKFITNSKDYSVFNYNEFSEEIDLTKKITVEEIIPYIQKILSTKYNLIVNINKLSLCLLITSFIERILVSIHKENFNSILPRTLSEMLIFISSEKILPTGIINLCFILIGPPISLNLRNLLWHGFLNDEQFTNTFFCSLVLLYQTLLEYDKKNYKYKELEEYHINYLNSYCFIQNDMLINEINKCQYIIPNRKEIIKYSINNIGLNSIDNKIHLLRLIVEFEHFLRICFISINNINIKFGMANYSSYYITLDVLLQENIIFNENGIVVNRPSTKSEIKITKYKNMKKFVKKNKIEMEEKNENNNEDEKIKFEKEKNKLIRILGNDILIKLYDLFLIENGIKLRDHLSHGEYNIDNLPSSVIKSVLFIWYVVLVKMNDYFYNNKSNYNEAIIKCLNLESYFHPITNFKKQLKETEKLLNEVNLYFNIFDYSDEIYNDYKTNIHNSFISKDLNELIELMDKKMINNNNLKLFGNPILISNIKQCNLIINEINNGLKFVKETHELLINLLKDKTIKRRQEDTLFKLIKSIDELLIIFKSFYDISKTIIYDNNNLIKMKLYKQTISVASKINILLKTYSFDGYEKLINDFINKIKILLNQ